MKEYMPGQGSYKVEEAGALTGIDTSYNVDNHWGTLLFDRDDVKISARGVDLALSSRFNSDHLYSTVIPKVSKSDGPAAASGMIPPSMMTLPADQTNFYRICNGWSWKLPFALLGVPNAFKFSMGEGKIFDFTAVMTDEAWGGTAGAALGTGTGNHCWTEGYEVTYYAENSNGISKVMIVIPEDRIVVVVDVQRAVTSGLDAFTPVNDSTFAVYLADGKKLTFNSHGFLSAITDMAGKNTLAFSYVADSRSGTVVNSSSRKTFEIALADYNAVLPGDLVIINDEIKVVFSKNGTDSNGGWISTSCNFDIAIPSTAPFPTYTILKGQLQMIAHTDGRAAKFYYYTQTINSVVYSVMSILLSSDQNINDFIAGDEFLGYYVFDSHNRLVSYNAVGDPSTPHATNTTNFPTDLVANQGTYFVTMQTVSYAYNLTNDPSPQTDSIVVTNNVGAPTIYYFQAGGFCSHSWNNAFFHRGSCRRGGSQTVMNIERPDFYIKPNNPSKGQYGYVNINRINQQAFYEASKADYQKDENAYDFNSDNEFNTQMFEAQQAVASAGLFGGILGMIPGLGGSPSVGGAIGLATGAASMALSADQFQHTQAKYARDRQIAANAPPVSIWAPIASVTSPNRMILTSALTVAPRQNDVYAVMNAAPDSTAPLLATSKDSTRIYVNRVQGSNTFNIGDYVFLRSEMGVINNFGTDNFVNQPFIEVQSPFSFVPDEGEQIAFCLKSNAAFPSQIQYYCYYLNKPKVVRIEVHDSLPETAGYWKRTDFEYHYSVQGSNLTDGFVDGGFTEDNVEGPNTNSFDASDITLTSTVITTGISNIYEDRDLTKRIVNFSYDEKSFHKGQSSEQNLRISDDQKSWCFVNKTVNSLGKPCANAGYYGVMTSTYYEGGDISNLSDGGGAFRKTTNYRYDVYGRAVRTTVASPYYAYKKSKTTWTQYVGSSQYLASQAIPDLDPLSKFSRNYLSGNYQQVFNTFYAMGLVGATIEEVDAYGTLKITYSQFDSLTGNLLMTDQAIASSLIGSGDMYSANMPNFRAVFGSTIITDPTQIDWSYQGSPLSSNWTNTIFEQSGTSGLVSHALTYYVYDGPTNNLIQITRPRGNTVNIAYGSSWKSSYITLDYKTFDSNIGGTTQYVVTTYDYDVKGRLIKKTLRFKTDTVDSDANLVVYGNNAAKTMTQYTYDGMNRLLTRTTGDGTTQTPVAANQYFDMGDSSWVGLPYMISTDYLGFRTKSYFDSRYRLVYVRRFKPNQNVNGNLSYSSSWEVGISSEQNIYDIATNKIAQTIKYSNVTESLGLSVTTRNSYDSVGRLTKIELKNTDPSYGGDSTFHTLKDISYDETMNAIVTMQHADDISGSYIVSRVENDWLGRGPSQEISWTALNGNGIQRIIKSTYRHDGKLGKKTLPNNQIYLYDYDSNGNLEKITYPDGSRVAMLYDLNGNLIQVIDRRNLSTEIAFNQSDMPVSKTSIDTSRGNTVVATAYTQFGPAKILKTEGSNTIVENDYWYHWSGGVLKQQQIIDGYTMEVDNTFDAAGNRITTTPTGSGSSPWTNIFNIIPQFHPTPDTDNFNRVAVADNSTVKNIITHEPDFLGLTNTIKYGDYGSPVCSVTHGYDKFLRVLTLLSSETNPYLNVTLTRDFIGNILSHQEPALSPVQAINNAYIYDGMTRLLSGEGSSQAYDELSSLVSLGSASYAYQDPNSPTGDQMRLATFNNGTLFSYSYDANGNPVGIANRFSSLSYDNLSMLRQIIYSQTDNYWYNDVGLRVKKTENAAGAWKTTYTLFEGDNPLLYGVWPDPNNL
jgi:YD repeat-containing protein